MAQVYIALGSNLQHPMEQISLAIAVLRRHQAIRLKAVSPRYQSAALGPGEQPDYINAVVQVETELPPLELLAELRRLETAQGRKRRERWGPRTLDLDILLYDQIQLCEPELTIPHPRMHTRNFVLLPLSDLEPGITLPDGTKLATLLAKCSRQGIVKIAETQL